jgi:hypothetical protein
MFCNAYNRLTRPNIGKDDDDDDDDEEEEEEEDDDDDDDDDDGFISGDSGSIKGKRFVFSNGGSITVFQQLLFFN